MVAFVLSIILLSVAATWLLILASNDDDFGGLM